jgi:hypothetical protein
LKTYHKKSITDKFQADKYKKLEENFHGTDTNQEIIKALKMKAKKTSLACYYS